MSTPVVTDQWAGNFDCEGPCRRKRLMAEEFSKKALERHRNQIRQPQNKPIILRCKQCIAEAERLEREASAKKKAQTQANGTGGSSEKEESRKCGSCGKVLPQSAFNRNQWSKGEGKSRCRQCVEESIKQEAQQQSQSKTDQIAAAKLKVEQARKSKSASAILAAESELAALEAEKVTGLKPVRMGTGGGRGGGKKQPWRRGGGGGGRGKGGRGGKQ
ncbi:unnamed protein product [Cylindrotheca closterium]|uniref:Stc1 domain-containing protein n=1 Tax=Cylindrotheca closterium TaxID=2856 RepID=A0AAD2FTQ2_9STRA|nr:unnamed protein product [Cylindrotheca closterium]